MPTASSPRVVTTFFVLALTFVAAPSPLLAAEGDAKGGEKARVIKAGDRLVVSVDDLEAINQKTVIKADVDAKGEVKLPYLKTAVPAAGLTTAKMEEAVVKAYHDAQLINQANVKVIFREAEDRKPQAPR
jgi:protein involved in polysaccharide export with SLBB domain